MNLKKELEELIEETMIPATHAFIEELQELNNRSDEEEQELNDMESFLNELQYIQDALKVNELSNEQIQLAYDNITHMLEEHQE